MKKIIFFIAVCMMVPLTAAAVLTEQVLQTKTGRTVFFAADDEVASLGGSKLGYSIARVAPSALKAKISDPASPYRSVFYASTVRNDRSRFVATGRVLVQLKPGVSADRFAAEQHLAVVKTVNASARIYLLAPSSRLDIIQQSNTLNTLAPVQYAAPEWIRPVLLR